MGVGNSGSRIGAIALALLAAVALCAALATSAGAVKLVGKNGRVYACYRAKAPRKGAVRLIPKKAKCRKGERKISWNTRGRLGEAGSGGENGENGPGAETGATGEPGAATIRGLEGKVSALTGKLASLEAILKGVTNTELLGALGKLQGVSGTGLQEAVAAVPVVKTLCAQTSKLTEQSNGLGTAVQGIALVGVTVLKLVVPQVPAALPKFGC